MSSFTDRIISSLSNHSLFSDVGQLIIIAPRNKLNSWPANVMEALAHCCEVQRPLWFINQILSISNLLDPVSFPE